MAQPQYTLPNWLHGGDPVGAYTSGAQIGLQREKLQVDSQLEWARLNQASQIAQQRIAQEQHQAEMELQVKQEVAQQAEARHAQELAVEKAYKDAEIGLRQSALQEKTTQAANLFAGQQKWKTDVLTLMDSGMDQDEAIMKATLSNPQMLKTASPLINTILKRKSETPPGPIQTYPVLDTEGQPIAGTFGAPGASGHMAVHNVPGFGAGAIEARQLKMNQIVQLERKHAALEKEQAADSLGERAMASEDKSPAIEANRKRYQSRKLAIEAMDAKIEALRGGKKDDEQSTSTAKRFRYDPDSRTIQPISESDHTEDADAN